MKRRAIPLVEKGTRKAIAVSLAEIAKAITSPALDDGGKLKPRQGLPGGSGINPNPKKPKLVPPKKPVEKEDDATESVEKRFYVPILKKNDEKQTVTGVVLQPEVTDGQGDIMSADVIEKAAETFLAKFNKATQLGLMHKNFAKNFELLQSFIAPHDLVIGGKTVKAGAWVIKVRVKNAKIWAQVKEGKLAGFSIGGKARVKALAA